MLLVSIVVPIYGVASFIEKCVRSLMEQTYSNIEYIFVNDCTKDDSMQILERVIALYPSRISNIKIINKQQNEGLPQARKTGMEYVHGKYVMHLDSDDWIETNMVDQMVSFAEKTCADIVYADSYYYTSYDKYRHVAEYTTPIEYMVASFYLQAPAMTWNKLYRTSLFQNNKIIFPKANMHEDLFINAQVFYYANKIAHINQAFYHYRFNTSSITRNYPLQSSIENLNNLKNFIEEKNIEQYRIPFYGFVNYVKSFYYKRHKLWSKESFKQLFSLVPNSYEYCFMYNPILKNYDKVALWIIGWFYR